MCEATIDDVLIVGLNDCGSAGRREWERLGRSPELLDELREGRTPAVERLAFLNRSLAEEVAAESLLLRGRRVLAEAAGLGLGVLTFRHEAHPPGLAALERTLDLALLTSAAAVDDRDVELLDDTVTAWSPRGDAARGWWTLDIEGAELRLTHRTIDGERSAEVRWSVEGGWSARR